MELRKLNSLTKYPSISTFHTLGPRQRLLETHLALPDKTLLFTEKVDGMNVRLVFVDDTYFIGMRDELAEKIDPRILDCVTPIAERIANLRDRPGRVFALYGEAYGGNIGARAKNYTGTLGPVGFRAFDMAVFDGVLDVLERPLDRIASWRQHGGTPFVTNYALEGWCDFYGVEQTPSVLRMEPSDFDTSHEGVLAFLRDVIPTTYVAMDESATRRAEGLIMRTENRSFIAKIRYEDYERTLRKG